MGLEYGTADILNETDDTPMSQSNEDSFRNVNGSMLRGDSMQAQDDTLRGMVYQFLAKVYVAGWVLLSRATNHATIHSTKFSLLVLFSVTAF